MKTQREYLRASDRRAATVEAVVALAARHNPSEITTTAIAQEMGLTQGAVFRHFATKDTILQAVMEWVAAGLMSRVDAAVRATASPLRALESLFTAHVEFVASHPGVPRILLSELQRAEPSTPKGIVQAFLRRYGERVSQLLADAKQREELPAALDTEAAAILFVGTIQGLVLQGLLAGDVTRIRGDAPRVFAIYRRGIEAQP
ncbi:MAG: TetR/AcrR family transcriptional regulator [Gemmatimonadetes bacterium]|nr:TetR/AcrR family transcriptional regulator [Gemmatimonadota bacterium]MCC6770768.1 TetR/AcrR family transcriptional regulator [Gemmatimonadaceae bacterium]